MRFLALRRRLDVSLRGSWQPVCGKIKEAERIRQAFVRQVREKTGQNPMSLFKLDFVNIFYDDYYDTVMFVPSAACGLHSENVQLDSSLHVEYRWLRVNEIDQYFVWRKQVECVEMIHDVVTGQALAAEFQQLPIET